MLLGRIARASGLGLLVLALGGCRSLPLQPAMDFSGPGWIVRQGQAVWRPEAQAGGIAGELLVAIHPDGRSVVRFTKTPLPFVVAQRSTSRWQVRFVPRDKIYSGRGDPPARVLWLHLPDGLEQRHDHSKFNGVTKPEGGFGFWNLASGESLEGFLNITSRPPTYVVRNGDSLSKIARQHGMTLKSLRDANPAAADGRIRGGQRLVIPPPAPPP